MVKDSAVENMAYEKVSDDAKFREQFRFVFSSIIVASSFVAPYDNIFEVFLKIALSVSAFLAGIYLISSAATIKYKNPRWVFQIFYASERLRARMYDWAVDIFAIAFLYFLGLLAVGGIQVVFKIKLEGPWLWGVLFGTTFIIAVFVLLISGRINYSEDKLAKKKMPTI